MSTGVPEAEAKETAPLLAEARTMLQKWEQGDAETRGVVDDHESMGIRWI